MIQSDRVQPTTLVFAGPRSCRGGERGGRAPVARHGTVFCKGRSGAAFFPKVADSPSRHCYTTAVLSSQISGGEGGLEAGGSAALAPR